MMTLGCGAAATASAGTRNAAAATATRRRLLGILLPRLMSDHAAANLIELDRLEQGAEVALAEAFVALALDDLEKDRTDHVAREDLQQDALFGAAVDQDLPALELGQRFAVSVYARLDALVVAVRRILKADAALAQHVDGPVDVACRQGDVLDSLAAIFAQVF